MKLFGIIFTLFPMIFIIVGATMSLSQKNKVQNYVKTEAVILSKRVETRKSSSSNGSSTTYLPVVEYKYSVNNREIHGNSVFPVKISAGYTWAHRSVEQFQVGKKTKVFYDPDDIYESYLIREISIFPYIFIIFPMIFVAIGIYILSGTIARARMLTPLRVAEGFKLEPLSSMSRKLKASLAAFFAWLLIGGYILNDIFSLIKKPLHTFPVIMILIICITGVTLLSLVIYYFIMGIKLSEPSVFINNFPLKTGTRISIKTRQKFKESLELEELSIGVLVKSTTKTRCGNKTTYSTNSIFDESSDIAHNQIINRGDFLRGENRILIPDNLPRSTDPKSKNYPKINWYLTYCAKIKNCPDYRGKYPVTVI